MLSYLTSGGTASFIDGLKTGGVNDNPDAEDEAIIQDWLLDQIDYIDGLATEIYSRGLAQPMIKVRAAMWVNKSLRAMFYSGLGSAQKKKMMMFDGIDGDESCPTCQRLKGQRHRMRDWTRKGLVPGVDTENFDCGGWQCKHRLIPTNLPATGRF
jgi:hypothetical protein